MLARAYSNVIPSKKLTREEIIESHIRWIESNGNYVLFLAEYKEDDAIDYAEALEKLGYKITVELNEETSNYKLWAKKPKVSNDI